MNINFQPLSSQFQSPPSVRKATGKPGLSIFFKLISIPAFREEGDASLKITLSADLYFNPRLP